MIEPIVMPAWVDDAACAGTGSDLFFPTDYKGPQADAARAVCAGCPVKDECLAACMKAEGPVRTTSRHGIYGGLTPAERSTLHRARRTA